jgi:hypothetical protein
MSGSWPKSKLETAAEEKPRVMAAGVVWTTDHKKSAGSNQILDGAQQLTGGRFSTRLTLSGVTISVN